MIGMAEWKKKRRRRAYAGNGSCYPTKLTHEKSLPRLVQRGLLPPPVGAIAKDGVPVFGKRAYYSEDTSQRNAGDFSRATPRDDLVKMDHITNNKTPTALADWLLLWGTQHNSTLKINQETSFLSLPKIFIRLTP